MFSLQHREELPEPVQRELDQLLAHLKGFLAQSFNEDGTLIVGSQAYNVVPTGAICPFAGGTVPDGWVLCDGAQKSRVDYKALFDVIGTTWGVGDGSTTFNVPDLRGRTPIGAGTGSGLTARTLGQSGGEETHILTTAELAVHNHSHVHTVTTSSGAGGSTVLTTTTGTGTATANLVQTDASNAGGGNAHNTMPPYGVVTWIILANRQTV